jgi:chromosome partitioning protein
MAVVITVAQQKGGAGKTMLAANLAAMFAATRRTALLDIDPQRTLARWIALRKAHPGVPAIEFSDVSGWRLGNELDRLRGAFDVVVIDTPPQIDSDARRAIRAADLVLVPVQPSAPDRWAAEGTLALAAAERRRAALVLNRAPTSSLPRFKALGEVRATGHTLLAASLGNRAGFVQAFAQGLGVVEAAPRSIAAAEMRELAERVGEMMA